MVVDHLKNSNLYYGLGKEMEKALKYLQQTDFSKLGPGKYEIDGKNVFALVQQYQSKPIEEGKWESHRKYIDIQFISEGIENIGYAFLDDMKVAQEYDEEKDFMLTEGKGSFLTLKSGAFAIFAPDDVHMPGIAVDKPQPIKKVVVKVLV